MEAVSSDEKLLSLQAGILSHFERAAELILEQDGNYLQQAYWELQMSCELGLKALQKQRTGDFTETHDLFILYDRIPSPGPAFPRDLLKRIPRWKDMVNLRYSQGERGIVADCFACYRAALEIVGGTIEVMDRPYRLGAASFEIGKLPWM